MVLADLHDLLRQGQAVHPHQPGCDPLCGAVAVLLNVEWWTDPQDGGLCHAFPLDQINDPECTYYQAAGDCRFVISADAVIRRTAGRPCLPCVQATAITHLPAPVAPPAGSIISDSEIRTRADSVAALLAAFRECLRSDEPPRLQDLDHVGGRLILFGGALCDRALSGTPIKPATGGTRESR